MDELVRQFETHRSHLRKVAYRMLGSPGDADDAVQEAWLRLSRTDADTVENLGGWLTTVVARVCLDMLRARKPRAEMPAPDLVGTEDVLADSIGPALLVVLDTLQPAERVAFVLHDVFAVPFEEIANIVGRSPTAARQLASRARRRVQGADAPDSDLTRERVVVEAFLAAARGGNFEALLAILDPDVVVRGDGEAVRLGAAAEVRGAEAVAQHFKGKIAGARVALVDGKAGAAWAPGGKVKVAFYFTFAGDKIATLELVADPARHQNVELLDD